jgi:hypothetical protein
VLAHSNGEVVDLLAGGQGVFNVLALSGVVEELDAAIVEIGAPTPERRPAHHPAAEYLASAEAAER